MAETRIPPNNGEVARIFERIADVLDVQGENPYKVKAYRNAVDTLRVLDQPVAKLHAEGKLTTLPGFGDAIRSKIGDILETGTTALYERIKDSVPPGVLEMLSLPGVGPKSIKLIWERLGVDSIDQLETALAEGKVATLPGMGEKTAQKITAAVAKFKNFIGGLRLDEAGSIADSMIVALSARPEVVSVEVAGAVRRGADTIHELVLVGVSTDPASTLDAFGRLPHVEKQLTTTVNEARVLLGSGIEAELSLSAQPGYPLLLLSKTGSQAHLEALDAWRQDAPAAATPAGPAPTDEDGLYRLLGLPYIPPVLREGTGEVEAAQDGALPRLLTLADIRGDVHAHTTATDGTATIEQMAAAAKARGYEYMAITDHSHSLAMVGGLTPERLLAQVAEIRALEDSLGIRIFAGSEVDIKADGTLDFDDDILAQLDIVIASAHLWNNQDRESQTRRIIRAIENPHVDLIAHPTGRLICRRDPYPVDVDRLIEAAARSGTALEINAAPERLDLKDSYARDAARAGVKIMINTDAHRIEEYGLMHYGITTAQRAWLTPADVLNTLSTAEFEAWLRRAV